MGESIEAIVPKDMILLDKTVTDRDAAIHYLIEEAQKAHLVNDLELMEEAVLAREEEISTAVGYQVAIPHGKSEAVNRPFIGFLRLKEGMLWNESDEVKLVFLIGVPKDNVDNIHLRFIAQLSKNLLDEDFRDFISKENSQDKLYEFFKEIDF
ncbi:fructose PTS transporter subunit IIA [Aerococcus urinae]|uniref:PTS sugar transporter subunit IIA n=1 Tax=Aerococcus urinae TaxID=1376 RepID=UPI0025507C03|nr:fructose PTS transporter subunit IIA [Aerococcus urinae]MDK6371086.1 fructose PTS transporter subunit IIA [Aerococcus urinae]